MNEQFASQSNVENLNSLVPDSISHLKSDEDNMGSELYDFIIEKTSDSVEWVRTNPIQFVGLSGLALLALRNKRARRLVTWTVSSVFTTKILNNIKGFALESLNNEIQKNKSKNKSKNKFQH